MKSLFFTTTILVFLTSLIRSYLIEEAPLPTILKESFLYIIIFGVPSAIFLKDKILSSRRNFSIWNSFLGLATSLYIPISYYCVNTFGLWSICEDVDMSHSTTWGFALALSAVNIPIWALGGYVIGYAFFDWRNK